MTRFITIARTSTLIAVASSLLAMTAPAFAAPSDDSLPQGTLNVAGIDFTSPKAVAHLKARVRHLAFDICVPDGDARQPLTTDRRECLATAIRNGLAAVDTKQELAMRNKPVDVAAAQIETHPSH